MAKPRSRRTRHVAILIEWSRAFGRGLIEGVARYTREHEHWSLDFEPRGFEAPPPWLEDWKGDGILARLPSRKLASAVLAKGVPLVDLFGTCTDSGFPHIAGDNVQVAKLAFDHLWEQGFRQFAYCGLQPGQNRYIDERGECFRKLAESAGCPFASFSSLVVGVTVPDWDLEHQRKAVWLKELPKPVGILSCYDEPGCHLLNACRRAGLQVPEEVAVVSVGNDAVLCEMTNPPMSSIEHDAPLMGYKAAALLDRLMEGAKPPRRPVRVPPRGLVARRSTDMLVTDDADLAAALTFIRNHAFDRISVNDIVRHVAVSQSVLERKFRTFLGRTPKAELLRAQMARAKELLSDSELPVKEIAARCGFSSEKYFSDAFHRQCGIRPAAFRRQRSKERLSDEG
jgi:LacI family transcriptional regulator